MKPVSSRDFEEGLKELIVDFLAPHLSGLRDHQLCASRNLLEYYAQETEDRLTLAVLLRLQILPEARELQVPNLFLPRSLRNKGTGKKLLKAIHAYAAKSGYVLLVTNLTSGFYQQLVRRGARVITEEDVVEITAKTDLTSASRAGAG